jgi:hypothetical protein
LNSGDFTQGLRILELTLNNTLKNIADDYGLNLRGEIPSIQFTNLIKDLNRKFQEKVVVIIDEYDKPLLSTIDNPKLHEEMRNALKGFYGVLKSADEHLKFVFLTGVTKFSKVSIFSDLNNLTDISLSPQYCDLCGITQEELEKNFQDNIDEIVKNTSVKKEDYLEKLKYFYNGYRFSPNPVTVYNPFGLLNHFNDGGEFNSYWYESGTPTFLIKLIKNQNIDIMDLEKKSVNRNEFRKYDVEKMPAIPVLYQSGYLTISNYDEEFQEFTLDYPNEEVRTSFAKSLISQYLCATENAKNALVTMLPKSLIKGEINSAMNSLISFLASIPYDIQLKDEKYYQTVVHLIFTMLGFNCRSEVRTASGRIDALVETKNNVYCFEFKLDGTADEALAQIDTKEYLLPWKTSDKNLFKIGVNFDFEKRNIKEWKVAKDFYS